MEVARLVSLPLHSVSHMPTSLWFWYYRDPITGKRLKTRYRCSEEVARKTYGKTVERVPNSLEIRGDGSAETQPGYMSKPPR